MNNSTVPIDIQTIVDKLDEISFELLFHSRAHYVSADYYEQLDSALTYIYSFCIAVSTACGGAGVVVPIIRNESGKHTLMQVCFAFVTLLFILGSTSIKELQDTQHSPAKKTSLHNEAALEMKQLGKQAAIWTMKRDNTNVTDNMMFEKYEEIVANHSNIEKKIKSEDWTFPCVHHTQAPSMIEKAKRLKKYIPEKTWPCCSVKAMVFYAAISWLSFVTLLCVIVIVLVFLFIVIIKWLYNNLLETVADDETDGTQHTPKDNTADTEKEGSTSVIPEATTATNEK